MCKDEVPGDRHAVGILLVHGIGEQPRGGTLLQFGDPLIRGLQRWFSRPGVEEGGVRGDVVVRAVHAGRGDEVPVHAVLDVVDRGSGPDPSASWLVAEHWWASSVQAPAFNRLAGWLFTKGVAVIFTHLTKRLQQGRRSNHTSSGRTRQTLREVVACLGALLASLGLQFVVALLFVLALVPIPKLREVMSRLLLTLSSVLGDTFVMVESQLQRGAIVGSTRRSVAWLAERCEKVIVVAHSQGAAIAHHALRGDHPPQVASLVTFGSGLEKLETLLDLTDEPGNSKWKPWMLGPALAVILFFTSLLVGDGTWGDSQLMAGIAIGIAAIATFMLAQSRSGEFWDRWITRVTRLKLGGTPLTWIDIASTRDPVPNGALMTASWSGRDVGVRKVEVANGRGTLGDHTGYWSNVVEFVPVVVQAICRVAGAAPRTGRDRLAHRHAIRQHRHWLRWRLVERGTMTVSLVLGLYLFREALRFGGERALAITQRAPWPMPQLFAAVTPFDAAIGPTERDWWLRFIALVPALLGLLAWHRAFEAMWSRVDRRFHERALGWKDTNGTDGTLIWLARATALAPLLFVVAVELFGFGALPRVMGKSLAVLMTVACLFGVWGAVVKVREALARPPQERVRAVVAAAGPAAVSLVLAIFMLSFVVPLPRFRDLFVAGIVVAVNGGFILRLVDSLARETRDRVRDPRNRALLNGGPVLAGLLVLAALTPRMMQASRDERMTTLMSSIITALVLYLLLVFILLRLVRRRPQLEPVDDTAPATPESAAD